MGEKIVVDQTTGEGAAVPPPGRLAKAKRWGGSLMVVLLVLWALHVMGVLRPVQQLLVARMPERPEDALLSIVDVFKCCVLSWKALTVMLPAFVLAGAIAAFVPAQLILRYLGAGSNRVVAFAGAAISGCILSLCSCNVVPLFLSIYRRGAGIGPAFAFLYAGPALNIVAAIFTIQVIGWRVGVWRLLAVPFIAVLAGWIMGLLFRGEEKKRAEEQRASQSRVGAAVEEKLGRVYSLLVLLLALVILGAWEMSLGVKIAGMTVAALATATVAVRAFNRDELGNWARETWALVRLVFPVLLPAVVIIGGVAAYVDIKLVYNLVGPPADDAGFLERLRPIMLADVFGALMYFPILSEIAFTKAFLKLGMHVGPALAVLLTGAGLSLPGLVIVARGIGWGKALTYQAIIIVLTTAVAYIFSTEIGEYICECMMLGE